MTVKEGFVPTPPPIADLVAMKALSVGLESTDSLLYPGAGEGSLLAATRRFCSIRDRPHPNTVAYERNTGRCETLRSRFGEKPAVPAVDDETRTHLTPDYPPSARPHERPVNHNLAVQEADYLRNPPTQRFDYILANPPYLRYRDIPEEDRQHYAKHYTTANGQFDLYQPFIEQMLTNLSESGYLVFIHPLSVIFSDKASSLRKQLRDEIIHGPFYLPNEAFPNHTVSTAVTVIEADPSFGRDGNWTLQPLSSVEFHRILSRLGHSDGEIDSIADTYRNRLKSDRDRLRAFRRRLKRDGGFDPSVDPYCQEEQQSLAAFA